MKKILLTGAFAGVIALTCAFGVGCSPAIGSSTAALTEPQGSAPIMPAGHTGRYEDLGVPGCYGCHGASSTANPMLATATILPENHYVDESYGTLAIDPVRYQCLSCHVTSN